MSAEHFACMCFNFIFPLPSKPQTDHISPVHPLLGRHLVRVEHVIEWNLKWARATECTVHDADKPFQRYLCRIAVMHVVVHTHSIANNANRSCWRVLVCIIFSLFNIVAWYFENCIFRKFSATHNGIIMSCAPLGAALKALNNCILQFIYHIYWLCSDRIGVVKVRDGCEWRNCGWNYWWKINNIFISSMLGSGAQ